MTSRRIYLLGAFLLAGCASTVSSNAANGYHFRQTGVTARTGPTPLRGPLLELSCSLRPGKILRCGMGANRGRDERARETFAGRA